MSASAFRRQVTVYQDRNLSQQALSRQLATAAKDGVAGLIQAGNAPPRYTRFVDGLAGAPEESVRADGVIVYQFERLADVVVFALAFLRQRAAGIGGAYQQGWYLGLDGRFVPASQFNPDTAGSLSEITIGNTLPYSRKADVQLVGNRRIRFRAPAGLFDDAVDAVRRRFGNSVSAKRIYTLRFPGQYVRKRGSGAGKPAESPAIVVTGR